MFISNAYAEAAAATGSVQDGFMQYLPLVALVAVFYFLVLRPQTKRAKDLKAMAAALQRGDEVLTMGGELGRNHYALTFGDFFNSSLRMKFSVHTAIIVALLGAIVLGGINLRSAAA